MPSRKESAAVSVLVLLILILLVLLILLLLVLLILISILIVVHGTIPPDGICGFAALGISEGIALFAFG